MLKISYEMIEKASVKGTSNEDIQVYIPWTDAVQYWKETDQIAPSSLLQKKEIANIALNFENERNEDSELLYKSPNLPITRFILPRKRPSRETTFVQPTIEINEKRSIEVSINKSMKKIQNESTFRRLSKAERRKKYTHVLDAQEKALLDDSKTVNSLDESNES